MSAQLENNPRRPNAVRPYKRPKIDLDELPPDYMALLSLLLGFAGLKYRSTRSAKNATKSAKRCRKTLWPSHRI